MASRSSWTLCCAMARSRLAHSRSRLSRSRSAVTAANCSRATSHQGKGKTQTSRARALSDSNSSLSSLILKRASASRPSGVWNDDDYDVLADGVVVGCIMKAAAAVPLGTPWLWTLVCGQHEDRTPAHGYEATA
jgi:hypothetical protein